MSAADLQVRQHTAYSLSETFTRRPVAEEARRVGGCARPFPQSCGIPGQGSSCCTRQRPRARHGLAHRLSVARPVCARW